MEVPCPVQWSFTGQSVVWTVCKVPLEALEAVSPMTCGMTTMTLWCSHNVNGRWWLSVCWFTPALAMETATQTKMW